jgi:adenosylmethionine-8-amino-7-oxononanoate aminotransferase
LSKGITGGFLPLGVTVSSQKIFDAFYSTDVSKTFFHGHSYTANPIACAAANASINILLDKICQDQIILISKEHALFSKNIKSNPLVKEVRQTGTIIAIELNSTERTSYFNGVRNHIYDFCLERGVLLRPLGNVLYILPPYCISKAQLAKVYHTITELLTALEIPHGTLVK